MTAPTCRACGSANVTVAGTHTAPLVTATIHDCADCGARFAPHDPAAHDRLHRAAESTYGRHHSLAGLVALRYEAGDLVGARALLDTVPKYRWVLETIEGFGQGLKTLELGCSAGFLTAHLSALGNRALGTDISASAVAQAERLFGPLFAVPDDPRVDDGAPWDVVFHVGTIGCVPDPVAFVRDHVRLLRPGGIMVFNAPNADACRRTGEAWGATTDPPDLVTLFAPTWWVDAFSDLGTVAVDVTGVEGFEALRRRLRPATGSQRRAGRPSAAAVAGVEPAAVHPGRQWLKSVGNVAAAILRVPRPPAEFGVHVVITRGSA